MAIYYASGWWSCVGATFSKCNAKETCEPWLTHTRTHKERKKGEKRKEKNVKLSRQQYFSSSFSVAEEEQKEKTEKKHWCPYVQQFRVTNSKKTEKILPTVTCSAECLRSRPANTSRATLETSISASVAQRRLLHAQAASFHHCNLCLHWHPTALDNSSSSSPSSSSSIN